MDAAVEEIVEIRRVLEAAVEDLLRLAEHGAALARSMAQSMARGETPDPGAVEPVFIGVMQACAFQDLVGQRLERLAGLLEQRRDIRLDADLLNGPTRSGLDQGAADRLMQAR